MSNSKKSSVVPADVKLARSLAALKAHATRQRNLLEAPNHAQVKTVAQASLKKILANMAALTGKPVKARRSKKVAAPTVAADAPAPEGWTVADTSV